MARRKARIIYPHLVKGVDWFVTYSVRDDRNGKMWRPKIYKGFDSCKTLHEKEAHANRLIKKYTDLLKNGWVPWESDTILYMDEVMYANEAAISTRQKTTHVTIRTYVSQFLKYKHLELQKKSYETYQSKLRLFVLYLEKKGIANKELTTYNSNTIIGFLSTIAKKKSLSRATIGKYVQILHTFFDWIRINKKLNFVNPVSEIPRIGLVKDEAPAAIPADMRETLLTLISAEDPQLWLASEAIYYSALRPGRELRLLKISNLNFNSRTITVRNYYAKTERTETIDMPDQLYEEFLKFKINECPADFYVFGKGGVPGPEFLSKNNMTYRFNRFRTRLKLPIDVKFYSWKHSAATELMDNGTNIYELQRHLRHKSITSTEQYIKKRLGQRSSKIKHSFPEIGQKKLSES